MTIAELERAIKSKHRTEKLRLQERALFDYKLADLMGKSFARTQHSANKMPELKEVYPELFDDSAITEEAQKKKQEKQDEISALRFKLFAIAHNEKLKKEAANN